MKNSVENIKSVLGEIIYFITIHYIEIILLAAISFLIFIIYNFRIKIKNKIGMISKNIYKIQIKNILYISIINILFAGMFELARNTLPNLLNIHFNFFVNIDYLTIYSCILGLVLPLAIMLIEKINNKLDYIVVETYLKNTMMFPFVIYFCVNLAILTILNEQYYFIFTSITSVVFIVFMYYKSFKLLSDLRYEKEKIGKTRFEIVNDDLQDQIKHFDNSNIISQYLKFGIKVERLDYISTYNFKKINIYPVHDLRKIEQYNYKIIDKIVKKLKIINKDYIEKNDLNNNIDKKEDIKPNIVIGLLDIGATIQKDRSCITIYYDYKFTNDVQNIVNLITDKIYITSETNNHFYIKANYEYLQNDCIKAINDSSSTLLSNSLNKYLDIYKDYIKGIRTNIGDYSYDVAYDQTHSIYELRAYEILKLIKEDIRDYIQVILKQNNGYLMNELINFLYSMILYSYTNNELLSIQYMHSLYNYFNFQSMKLTDNKDVYRKIKLELFEFIGIVEYDINLDNMEFCKNVLLVCNKTISAVLFELSKENDQYFFQYLRKIFKFINEINEKLEQIQYSENESNVKMTKIYKEILINYNCNFFATLSYVVINWEEKNKDVSSILNFYKNYDIEELTSILLDTIDKDYNDKTYSWDLLDDHDLDESDGMWNVNTSSYLQHLYCLLLNRRDSNRIQLPLSYPLSTHSDTLIKEFEKMDNKILVDKINKLVLDVNDEEKKYIRSTPISLDKINLFKSKFVENYYKNAKLYEILNSTNNIIRVKKRKKGVNYIGLNNIVDKTYFLSRMPNDRTIIWTNFEEGFADAFIRGEEGKYSKLLEKKSKAENLSISDYLKSKNLIHNKYIIFADYSAICNILQYSNISYNIPDNIKYNGLKSSHYFKYNNYYIPIFSIDGLKEDCVYLFNTNELGCMEKYCNDFEITIKDFYNNKKLLEEFMNTQVNGLELSGDERKNHLLESVNLNINEYVRFDDKKMNGIKFVK